MDQVRGTRVTLVDDLDGSQASETVYLSFEGVITRSTCRPRTPRSYEKAVRRSWPFGEAANHDCRGRSSMSAGLPDRRETAAISEWARQHGHKIAGRGRMPGAVLKAYREEMS